jgi:hypothetical protein
VNDLILVHAGAALTRLDVGQEVTR